VTATFPIFGFAGLNIAWDLGFGIWNFLPQGKLGIWNFSLARCGSLE
jgi:hypothetical protein